jgi:quinol monooxygenase YgiN
MSEVLEIVRFTIDAEQREEFLRERPAAIEAIRAAFPGLLDAQLAEQEDGSWTDVVRWRSRAEAEAAAAGCPELPAMRQWIGRIGEVRELIHADVRHGVSAA